MGCAGSSSAGAQTNMVSGANGELRPGVRVQTQYERSEGGDDRWYCGTIEAVYMSGKAKIRYDDGDTWTGPGVYINVLPPHHPGFQQKVGSGAPTMEGIPGMVGSMAVAQPMGQPMGYGAQPMGYGAQPMGYGAQPMGYGAPTMYAQPTVMAQPVGMAQPVVTAQPVGMAQPVMGQPV